ncbi:MAG: two-component sensor histidine kinase [Deltaproteobacteria bacterium]|jgi:signal transduction histidine kinase|nr:two-component sensor histidine kinase [Deltaproteobacteria bacterium]
MTEARKYALNWDELPLSYARALSWISLVLILCTSLGISVVIANSARETLLTKQTDFALLLAENLNHQIYRRFTLPTMMLFGRIALRQPAQNERMDMVVLSVVHGWQLKSLRIYDSSSTVAYSMDKVELGNESLAGTAVRNALQGGAPEFEIISDIPAWQALFMLATLEPDSFVLRTTFPLRVQGRPDDDQEGDLQEPPPTMGVLEFHQDITGDFKAVIAFQWLIVGTIMLSAAVLFTLLLLFIRRADSELALRLAQNRALEEDLHMNERLASMGRVVASIAHEIRNPLGIIRSSAELLLRRAGQTDPRTSGILQAIYDESVRLSQTVNDFVDYARPHRPRQDNVDLVQVLKQVLAFQEGHIERQGVEVELDLHESLPLKGDKDLLYRALYNLVVNALQAMEGPGKLHVSGLTHADGRVNLALRDSGPGFSPEQLQRMMDPFFTTKDSGTGLGLPIVNNIIGSHGGVFRLENAAGGGAVARLSLPGPSAAQDASQGERA